MLSTPGNLVAGRRIGVLALLGMGLVFLLSVNANGKELPNQSDTALPAAKLPEFEVATIKPDGPGGGRREGIDVYRGGRVAIKGVSFKSLICTAFNLSYWQVSGGGDWTGKVFYDVEAKPSEAFQSAMPDTSHTLFTVEDGHLRQMLQALLIDRFQLKFHRDTKTGTVYQLENSGNPLRLKPAKVDRAGADASADASRFGSIGLAGQWNISYTSMPQLAKFANDYVLHAPVQDQTGLSGLFNYRSPIEVDPDAYVADNAGSFLNLLAEIGLKLQSAKGPVETFVIDHAEQPSPNESLVRSQRRSEVLQAN
jgi:uncharacterized protein (TIGR03435 family)